MPAETKNSRFAKRTFSSKLESGGDHMIVSRSFVWAARWQKEQPTEFAVERTRYGSNSLLAKMGEVRLTTVDRSAPRGNWQNHDFGPDCRPQLKHAVRSVLHTLATFYIPWQRSTAEINALSPRSIPGHKLEGHWAQARVPLRQTEQP